MILSRCPVAIVLTLAATPLLADEPPALPPDLTAIVDEARHICESDGAGKFEMAPEAARQIDLNGDGTPDWILDQSAFSCSTSATLYCGTQGCGVETVIDGVRGSLLLHDWGTLTEGGTIWLTAPNDQGETVRFLWTGTEWQLQ